MLEPHERHRRNAKQHADERARHLEQQPITGPSHAAEEERHDHQRGDQRSEHPERADLAAADIAFQCDEDHDQVQQQDGNRHTVNARKANGSGRQTQG
ncbi:hypothetical protein [Kibdelosporangium philippinense]|uniref:hypothetical protein n=1 Tax=Kibdelosporangium philippinense TaxID=211113 RepID=UPI0035F02FEA